MSDRFDVKQVHGPLPLVVCRLVPRAKTLVTTSRTPLGALRLMISADEVPSQASNTTALSGFNAMDFAAALVEDHVGIIERSGHGVGVARR